MTDNNTSGQNTSSDDHNNDEQTISHPSSPTSSGSTPSSNSNSSNSNSSNSNSSNSNSSNSNSSNSTSSNSNSSNSNTNTTTSSTTSPNTDIINFTLNETINQPKVVIVNKQGTTADGTEVTHTTFTTTDTNNTVQINEDLLGTVSEYDAGVNNPNKALLDEIKAYANEIKCEDFHGKGTVDDYKTLFEAAANIANESKQMQLDVDVQGFNEFGQAADDLSKLFESFIVRLQNVNIINDTLFLTSIASSLKKIVNLSNTFGNFKKTILATSTLQIPKSVHDTKVILQSVMGELDCAMNYITYFVAPTEQMAQNPNAQLSAVDKNIINSAISTINSWNVLCDQGVSISLANNPDIQFMKQANTILKNRTTLLNNAANILKDKFPHI
jgi:hypothetical protein